MLSFIVRRLLQTIPIILAVALLIFVMFSVIPGTFASSMGDDGRGMLDAQVMERMNKEFGLADPVYVRFGKYVWQLAQLDLGTSFRTRQPVSTVLADRMWPTLQLSFAAMIFSIVIGVPLGFIAALKPGCMIDTASMVGAVSGLSLPKFWLGLLLMYLFALKLGWLPSFGYGNGGLRNLTLRRSLGRRAARPSGTHHARGGSRDHECGFRPHRALQRNERAACGPVASCAKRSRHRADDDRLAVRHGYRAGRRRREAVCMAGSRIAPGG